MDYRPKEIDHLDCAMRLLEPVYDKYNGVATKTYRNGALFFANFKSYGGTETTINDVYSIIDTATITTWFRPDIKSGCLVERLEDGAKFKILNEPEDVNFRHQFLIFKVERLKGEV